MGKTLILSDIHFCKKSSTCNDANQLRNLWLGCDELILNGDTCEEHNRYSSVQSRACTEQLITLATLDGVRVILICGNHDPEHEQTHVWKSNKRILITHGHVAFPGVAPWSWRSQFIQKVRTKYLQSTGDGFHEQLAATTRASIDAATGKFKSHTPSKFRYLCIAIPSAIHVLIGWLTFPTRIHNWAQKYAPSAQIIITGHTHHAGIWKRGTQTIVNTGCFGFPSHPRAVVIENELVVVHKLRCNEGRYSLGKVFASLNVR